MATRVELLKAELLKALSNGDANSLFAVWDQDGSGSLSPTEFYQALLLLGLDVNGDEAGHLFNSLDIDGNRQIDYRELRTALQPPAKAAAKPKAPPKAKRPPKPTAVAGSKAAASRAGASPQQASPAPARNANGKRPLAPCVAGEESLDSDDDVPLMSLADRVQVRMEAKAA